MVLMWIIFSDMMETKKCFLAFSLSRIPVTGASNAQVSRRERRYGRLDLAGLPGTVVLGAVNMEDKKHPETDALTLTF